MVESFLAKEDVASSNLVTCSNFVVKSSRLRGTVHILYLNIETGVIEHE